MTGARGSPGKRVNICYFRFVLQFIPFQMQRLLRFLRSSVLVVPRYGPEGSIFYTVLCQLHPENNMKLWFYQMN